MYGQAIAVSGLSLLRHMNQKTFEEISLENEFASSRFLGDEMWGGYTWLFIRSILKSRWNFRKRREREGAITPNSKLKHLIHSLSESPKRTTWPPLQEPLKKDNQLNKAYRASPNISQPLPECRHHQYLQQACKGNTFWAEFKAVWSLKRKWPGPRRKQ